MCAQDVRDVDAALAEVEARLAQHVDHLVAVGRYLGRRVADLREVEPLARQRGEIGRAVAGAVEMVRVDHQPGVVALRRAQHVDRAGEVVNRGDRHRLEIDASARTASRGRRSRRISRS